MRQIVLFILVSMFICCMQLLLSDIVFATYVISGSETVKDQNYHDFYPEGGGNGGVFYVKNTGTLTVISSKFTNNRAITDISGNKGYGGAIYNEGKTIIIGGVLFSSNSAVDGGAIYNRNNSTMTISGTDIIFSSNRAEKYGGAIFNGNRSTMTITADNITFSSNSAGENGGAIYNYENSIMTINSTGTVTFNSNSAKYGGAIFNGYNFTMTISSTETIIFNSNSAGSGGAIFNENGSAMTISGNNITFSSNSAGERGGAIANYENSIMTINSTGTVTFSSNSAGSGGAIENYSGSTMTISGNNITFSSNSANYGGAIYNYKGSTMTISGTNITFSSNSAGSGGAIYNYYGATMTISGTDIIFSSNSAGYGGAIENYKSTMTISGTDITFSFNSASSGGAINNENNSKMDIFGDNITFSSNRADAYGGAIDNNDNSKLEISGDNITFSSNSSEMFGGSIHNFNNSEIEIFGDNIIFSSNSAQYSGGAIENYDKSTIGIYGENIRFKSNSAVENGGAVENDDSTLDMTGEKIEFVSNRAGEEGGAIANINDATMTVIASNITFNSNSANGDDAKGGAIYNENSTLNLMATEKMEFTGNTADGESNAIHDNGGTINLSAMGDNSQIIINDRITSENADSTLNINETLWSTGKIVLNEDMTGYTGQVNLYAGTVQIGANGTWFGGNAYVDDATINMVNGMIKEHNFNNLTVNQNLNLFVDANLKKKEMDTISANNYSGEGKINVKALNIIEDATENRTKILFTSSTALKDKITTVKTANSQLYKYDVNYNSNTGNYEFLLTQKANPVIAESQVALVGGMVTQVSVLNQVFRSMDVQLATAGMSSKQKNRLYASRTGLLLDRESTIEDGLWIRPYAQQDTMKINGINIDNTAIGTLAGIDLAVEDNTMLSFYIGTAGSSQKYEGIKVNQTGYILGTSAMIIKEEYYLGLTANVNFNKAESENNYGKDKFNMNMYSIGARAGYNIDLGKKWTLEPNLTMMYGNINSQGYTTSQGTQIDGQKMNNIYVQPQVKARIELKDGWTPYALLGYAIDTGNKAKLVANDIEFEEMKVKGYTEYGAGVHKRFKNNGWSCYAQLTGKSGERKGIEGNIGVKYSFIDTIGTKKKEKKYDEITVEEKMRRLEKKLEVLKEKVNKLK